MATVTLSIQGVRGKSGDLIGGLYRAEDFKRFGGGEAAYRVVSMASGEAVVFEEVAPGTYAAAVYHDENGNGKLDLTFVGTPSEGRGYSNTNTVRLAPPSFDEASFDVASEDLTLDVQLRYPR